MPDGSLLQPLHPGRDGAMRAAYGFGLFPLPSYRDAVVGDWRVVRYGPAPVDGYLPGVVMEPWRWVLHQGSTPWMSTSLMEQESHAWHVHQARGVVLAAGLGMAMYAYAASLRPEVERVVVVERSREVIAILGEAAELSGWPGREKVAIVEGDALGRDLADRVSAVTGGRPPDYLYADIWPDCGAPDAPAQTAAMVRALCPHAAGWWGQELSFGLWCREAEREPDEPALRDYVASTGIPVPVTPGYAAFCADVIAGRLSRRRWPALGRLWARLRGSERS